jgi:hypothetical protein
MFISSRSATACAADDGRARVVTGLGSGTSGAERGLGRSLVTSWRRDVRCQTCGALDQK